MAGEILGDRDLSDFEVIYQAEQIDQYLGDLLKQIHAYEPDINVQVKGIWRRCPSMGEPRDIMYEVVGMSSNKMTFYDLRQVKSYLEGVLWGLGFTKTIKE